ncbi:MAG: hypothetical protein LC799_19825 [Actinobacteria bacterium]|nr:hypothetical protein [Actinomycetota bacterium]
MSFRRRRRRIKIMVLGLAVAAVGAGSAQATVIPYLSQGEGISSLQMAQLQNATPSVESQYMAPSGRTADPSIAVAGAYLDPASQYAPGSWNTPELGLVLVAGAAMFTLRRGRKGQLAGA